MLQIKNISHSYDNKPLLRGVDFDLPDNEVLCILGPSGSGKSTLLRIIAGLEYPEEGKIFWNGEDITVKPVYKRNFGMVFQDYALFPHMNVFENVAFGLEMAKYDKSDIKQRVDTALCQVGMQDFANRSVTELSGGEQQRIALARSLVVEPAMLMLDEPLGALDHSLRQSVIDELRDVLGKNGISAIYVTHDQEEAFALADTVAILHDGVLIQKASPDQLFRHPVNVWCARFLGLTNLLPCTANDDGKVFIRNYDQILCIKTLEDSDNSGRSCTVLLNGGHLVSDGSHEGTVLSGTVSDSLFHGVYCDLRVEIDQGTFITIRNDQMVPISTRVAVSFTDEEICIFKE